MFSNAKLIINYSESKTKVSINNIVNVQIVEWASRRQINFFLLKERVMSIIILVKTKSLVNTHLLPLINKLIY